MAIQHRDITDPEIHEPKGIPSAPAGTVYKSLGNGTGVWGRITPTNLTGVNSNSLPDRRIVTDGEGGFKLESSGGYASIYSNSNPTNWSSGPLRNMTRDGNKVAAISPGFYLIHYSITLRSTSETDTTFNLRVQVDGVNNDLVTKLIISTGQTLSGTGSCIVNLGSGSKVGLDLSGVTGNISFEGGLITAMFLGV